MKTSLHLAFALLLSVSSADIFSQSVVISTINYDTTVVGTGSMYPPYEFSFPKFQGSLGTLTQVKVASVLTWNYGFTMESQDNSTKTARVKILRTDEITSSALPASILYDFASPLTNYNLGASDGITGSGPDFRSVAPVYYGNADTIINETFNNTADFIGAGSVNFQYGTDVGYSASGATLLFFGQASDQIKMSLRYVYSSNVVLSTDITSFTVSEKNGFVNITWATGNEYGHGTYEVLKSADGKNFTPVKKFNASSSGKYAFGYISESSEKGKIYFRIKQDASGGTIKYSPLRSVIIAKASEKKGFSIFPNPVRNGKVSLVFNDDAPGTYEIQLINVKGQTLHQTQVSNVLKHDLHLNNQLQAGDYFIMAINKTTGVKSVEKLVVQ